MSQPGSPGPPGPPDAATEARRRAELLVSAGRAREAVALLEQAVAGAPNDGTTLCHLALAYLHAGDRPRQLHTAERAAAADPESEWAHRLRCDALGALGRQPEAVEAARRALALAPREPLALLCLVKSLRAIKAREEARVRAEELVALAPQKASSHESLALVALDEGRLADAEAGMRRALALDPESATYHNNLGLVLLRQERRAEAVAAFENAARLDPTMEIAQQNLSIGLRSHLHRGLRGLITDGVMRLIPGADRPELARRRRVAAGAIAVVLAVGFWLWLRYAPHQFPTIFLTTLLGSAFVAPRLRLRRMSPTLQRFAASRRLASPNVAAWKRVLLILLVAPFFLGALALAAVGIVRALSPSHGDPNRVLVFAVGGACFYGLWRAVRGRRGG